MFKFKLPVKYKLLLLKATAAFALIALLIYNLAQMMMSLGVNFNFPPEAQQIMLINASVLGYFALWFITKGMIREVEKETKDGDATQK